MHGTGKRCLVLSGGGAKGIYHIGAARAFRELGMDFDAYVGNSIGAIVAAYLALGRHEELERIGDTITLGTIVDLKAPEDGGGTGAERASLDRLGSLYRELAARGGFDTGPLRRTLERDLDEAALRASGLDYGLTTVNLSDLAPRELFLDRIPEGSLVDYLMASSALPGFELPEIEGKRYLDGGFYDNIPFSMALARGYRDLVIVDVSGLGVNRRPAIPGASVLYLRNSIEMGGVLDFDRGFLDRFRELGYLDAMRAAGRLAGDYCFIRQDEGSEAELEARAARVLAADSAGAPPYPPALRHERRHLLASLDCAAKALGVERVKTWTYAELAAELSARRAEEEGTLDRLLADVGKGKEGKARLDELVFAALRARELKASPWFYARAVERAAPGFAKEALRGLLDTLCPELRAAERYFVELEALLRNPA